MAGAGEPSSSSSSAIPDSDRVVDALRADGTLEHLRTLALEVLERDVRAWRGGRRWRGRCMPLLQGGRPLWHRRRSRRLASGPRPAELSGPASLLPPTTTTTTHTQEALRERVEAAVLGSRALRNFAGDRCSKQLISQLSADLS